MKKYIAGGITFLFLFFPTMISAQIVINEIGAYEKTDSEWIEIYNNGSEAIDITGWKFYENTTNHALNAAQGDMIIPGGEYAIIAQKGDVFISEKNFLGTVIDSSWGTLKEDGEEIGLKDSFGNIIELFTYIAAPNFSLERKNPSLSDYTSTNWKEHGSGNTTGFQNSNYISGGETQPMEPEPTPTPLPETPTTTPQTTATTTLTTSPGGRAPSYSYQAGDIIINEFVSDPSDEDNEWVELFNKTPHNIDISQWYIEEGSETKTILLGTLPSRGFFIIEKPRGNLNNSGDIIFLKDAHDTIIDQVTYGIWKDQDPADNAPEANDPNSTARIYDGYDSGNDYNDWNITATPTKGSANIISEEKKSTMVSIQYPKYIIINEAFPNPATSSDEFIEIKNIGVSEVDLTGWKLGDATENRFEIPLNVIAPNSIKIFYRSVTKIALNNTGKEEVRLFWPNDELASSLSYSGSSPRGKSFSRDENGKWAWSLKITPGENNIIEKENEPPFAVIHSPKTALVNEILAFDASDSYDPDGDTLEFLWEFGDGRQDSREYPNQIYIKTGEYIIKLKVIDVKFASSTAKHQISIINKETEEQRNRETEVVYISEFLPNPIGDEKEGEFIELFNPNSFNVDLTGWILDDGEGGSKQYNIPEETQILSNQYLLLAREETQITLNNTSDGVRLFNALGALVEEAKYEKTFEGMSFIRNEKGGWEMTRTPTPSEINALNSMEQRSAPVPFMDDMRDAEAGNAIVLEGIALVEPGVLGSQIFYMGDSNGGMQMYMFKKDWPKITSGDRVRISGEVSQYREEPRLKISEKSNIQILEKQNAPTAEVIKISEIHDKPHGILATVEGEITDTKANGFYIDDGTEELYSYIKQSTGIEKIFKNGDMVSVTGIFIKTDSDTRLLPRYQEDIKVTRVLSASLKDEKDEKEVMDTTSNSMNPYLISTIIALILINARLFYMLKKKEIKT